MRLGRSAGLVGFVMAAAVIAACSDVASPGASSSTGDAGATQDAAPSHDAAPSQDAAVTDAADAGDADAKPPYVASEACPLKSPAAWQSFLEAASTDARWVKTCSDQSDCSTLSDFSSHVTTDVLGLFASCAQDLVDNPGIAACTASLRRYAPAWVRQHAVGSYGFTQDNPAYFAAQTAAGAPTGMMDPPSALLAALPTNAAVVNAARENGWPYLIHDSGLGGVRTILAITDPQGRFEQWMVMGLSTGESLAPGSIMSFLAIQRTLADGTPLARPRIHFRDYLLGPTKSGWATALPADLDGKCYACHGSGPRVLVPLHGSIVSSSPVNGEPGYGAPPPVDFGFTRLQSLNARLLAYGPPDWNGTIDPRDHGPTLGEKLGCPGCHDGVTRGPVNVSTSEGMLYEKVVGQLSMRATTGGESVPDEMAIALLDREATGAPPLSEPEKAALSQAKAAHLADYQALIADRFPAWRRWVLATGCE